MRIRRGIYTLSHKNYKITAGLRVDFSVLNTNTSMNRTQAVLAREQLASQGLLAARPTLREKSLSSLGVRPRSASLGFGRRKTRRTRRHRRRGGGPDDARPVLPPIRQTPAASLARSELLPGSPGEYSPVQSYDPSPPASPATGSRQEKFENDLRLAARGKGRRRRHTKRSTRRSVTRRRS